MEFFGKVYNDFCEFIEKENRLTHFGLWGISGGLLTYAYLRRLPIKKFVVASNIPENFIRERILQKGTILNIRPTALGPVLLVNHKPPINLSFTKQTLPVQIAAIRIDSNGTSWLQTLATGKEVQFLPLNNKGDQVDAQVFLVENEKVLDLGNLLISMGFAKLMEPSDLKVNRSSFESYYKLLKSTESRAKRLRKGQWNVISESWLSWRVRTTLGKIVFNMNLLRKKNLSVYNKVSESRNLS